MSSTGLGEEWKAPLLKLFERKVEISRALTTAMALAMGKAEHELLDMCETGDSISIMRCFHYLPLPDGVCVCVCVCVCVYVCVCCE